MDFKPTEKQRTFREKISRFMKDGCGDPATAGENPATDIRETLKGLAGLKVMGMTVPEQYGGGGMDFVTYVMAVIEISKVLPPAGTLVVVNNSLFCSPLTAYGSDHQKSVFLRSCASGDKMGCYGFLESEGDSDLKDLETCAVREDEEWVINGVKRFVYGGDLASYCLLAAVTEDAAGEGCLTHFLIDLDKITGVKMGPLEQASGVPAATGTLSLIFENARVPVDALMGARDQGPGQAKVILTDGRMGQAAQAVGIGRAVAEISLIYIRKCLRFGKPLSYSQTVQWKLADMAMDLDAAELLTLKAASYKDLGKSYVCEANIAKVYASNAAMKASVEGMQILCGQGYVGRYPLETYMRDAKISQISMGSNDTVRQAVAMNFIQGI